MTGSGVLDQCYDAVGHELGGSHWGAATSAFGDCDHASSGRDLNSSAGPGGCHLVRADVIACFDDDLDAITFHVWITLLRGGILPVGLGAPYGTTAAPRRGRYHSRARSP